MSRFNKGYRFLLLLFYILISSQFAAAQNGNEEVTTDSTEIIEVPSVSYDDDDYYFDSVTATPAPIEARQLPDSVYENLRKDENYWYVNLAPPRKAAPPVKKKEDSKSIMDSAAVRNTILVILVLIFIGAIIWFLTSSNIKLFDKPRNILQDENAEITEEDLFSINYENEIRNAVLAGNFRFAVRLWYLRTLRELTEKKLISYAHEKTNTEYLDELYETKYYSEFKKLTRNFEYVWYGKFDLTEQSYKIVEKEFAGFNRYMR